MNFLNLSLYYKNIFRHLKYFCFQIALEFLHLIAWWYPNPYPLPFNFHTTFQTHTQIPIILNNTPASIKLSSITIGTTRTSHTMFHMLPMFILTWPSTTIPLLFHNSLCHSASNNNSYNSNNSNLHTHRCLSIRHPLKFKLPLIQIPLRGVTR